MLPERDEDITAADLVDPLNLPSQEQRELCWRAGNLSYLVLPFQRDVYDAFWAWQAVKHLPEKRREWADEGYRYHMLWCWEIARRWGKTVLAMLLVIEFCIRRPGSVGLLCTAVKDSIPSIILKILRQVFEAEAPPGYCPEFRGGLKGESDVLYLPAVNSTITLVGLDKQRDKTRGNYQDFCLVTEAGFVTGLKSTFQSAIAQQFRGRPWAWALFESSTSPVPDHDFQTDFKADCEGRGTHVLRTIEDSGLSEEEIELECLLLGGRESADAQRELFCRQVPDQERAVVPEFDEALDVGDWAVPQYACCVTALDPGTKHKCGLVLFNVDFLNAAVIVQAAWAESNRNTEVVAGTVRELELELWSGGSRPLEKPQPTSVADMLKPIPAAQPPRHPPSERVIAGASELGGGAVWTPPDAGITWWDNESHSLRPNPWKRVSDVQAQMQLDLRELHGLDFESAQKGPGSRLADINNLRVLTGQRRVRIMDNGRCEALIEQLRSGRWNEKRTDFEVTPKLGHLDCLKALAYGLRCVPWALNPYRPRAVDPYAPDTVMPIDYAKLAERKINPRKGGRGPWKTYR